MGQAVKYSDIPQGFEVYSDIPKGFSVAKPKTEDLDAIRKAQAAKYPTKDKVGVQDDHPSVANFMTNLWGNLNAATAPLDFSDKDFDPSKSWIPPLSTKNQVEAVKGAGKLTVSPWQEAINEASRNGASVPDVLKKAFIGALKYEAQGGQAGEMSRGMTEPIVEQVKKGDYSGAAGSAGGTAMSFMLPGAVEGAAGTVAPIGSAGLDMAGMSKLSAPEAIRRLADPQNLQERAIVNREVGGNIIKDASEAKNSLVGAARLGRNVYSRIAAPVQEVLANALDKRTAPIGNAVIDDSTAQIAGPMETQAIRRASEADQYRPQFTEPTLPETAESPYGRLPDKTVYRPAPDTGLPSRSSQNPYSAIEEAIAPRGKGLKLSQMVDAEGKPTRFGQKLVEVVPEIQTATKETAPSVLKQGLDRVGKQIEAAESAIPDKTPMNPEAIADKIGQIIEDYAGDERSVAQLNKEWERWAGQKNVTWGDFITIKRNLGRNLTSPALRRAYRVLVEASTEVSDDLRNANEGYSAISRAMESGGIDKTTGRRLSTVGKPTK